MKNIKKASVVSVLSLALAIPLTASAAATTDVAPATTDSTAVSQSANTSTDVNTPKVGDHVITPQATDPVLDVRLRGTEMSKPFTIRAGYGYVKVWVRNNGSQKIKLTVTQGSGAGTVKLSGTIYPGEDWSSPINSSAWSTGDFYVNLTSGSADMSGQVSVRTGTTRGELE
ncbi:hypothetical protein [Paenibacillus terrae]|uniref:hypothetical protein n=1 Tax=Paenibacillus terrae TaxID=159743 RepID=UPI0021CD0899|nr:hypothetical protein [Paenibacillus terrae]